MNGSYDYNQELFFLNRDPRFYRTFAFPGVEWKFDSDDLKSFGEKGQLPCALMGILQGIITSCGIIVGMIM